MKWPEIEEEKSCEEAISNHLLQLSIISQRNEIYQPKNNNAKIMAYLKTKRNHQSTMAA